MSDGDAVEGVMTEEERRACGDFLAGLLRDRLHVGYLPELQVDAAAVARTYDYLVGLAEHLRSHYAVPGFTVAEAAAALVRRPPAERAFEASGSGSASTQSSQRPGAVPARTTAPAEFARPQFRLPNGRVDESYAGRLEPVADGPREVDLLGVDVPPELGLAFDPQTRVVAGVPARDGEFQLVVRYRYRGDDDRPSLTAKCTLVVNPDPRSLWKDLEVDPNDAYFKPSSDSRLLHPSSAPRRLIGASKRGRSHAHTGHFREDDFALAHIDAGGWSILAVADGAGSCRYSRHGSRVATLAAVDALANALGGPSGADLAEAATDLRHGTERLSRAAYQILGQSALCAVRGIEEEAARKGVAPRDYSTTLLLAVHRRIDAGDLVATFWCGDGGIGLYHESEGRPQVKLMGEVDSGDFAGQTRFLDRAIFASSLEVNRRVRATVVPDLTALVLMTDGVSDPKFDTERNLSDPDRWHAFWEDLRPCLQADEPQAGLLAWLDFWSPGSHDDRTIAVLW